MYRTIKNIIFNILLGVLVFFLPNFCISQEYADKNYYLIDSLDFDNLVDSEQKLIQSSLLNYHNTTNEASKLKAIHNVVENSNADEVWHKYNKWIHEYSLKALSNNINTKNPSKREKYLLKYYAHTINNLGIIYNDRGDLPKALEYYYKSLAIREQIKDSISYPESYNNIASLYRTLQDYKKSEEFFNKALFVAEKNKDNWVYSRVLSSLASLYIEDKRYIEAEKLIIKNIELSKPYNDQNDLAHLLRLKANVSFLRGKLDEAFLEVQESIHIFNTYGNIQGKLGALKVLAMIYIKMDKLEEAKAQANNYLNLAKKTGITEDILDASLLLSEIYKKEENWKQALPMTELYFKMKDSIQNSEVEKELIREKAAYDIAIKEREIEKQNYSLARRKNSIIFISIALLLALSSTLFYFKSNKKKQLINKLLEKQKAEISRKNEDKKHMLQEIHHRVKNNLQVVNSLLRMQSSKMEDEDVISMFKETQSRVNSMAKLHEKMYQSGDLNKVNAKEHITLLIKEIVKNYSVDTHIDLNLDIANISLDAQTMMPLSLIINEMITNSLKYAFEGKSKGAISVELTQKNTVKVLIVKDNGIGYKTEEAKQGLGSKLINSFVKQLNGTLEQYSNNGTVYKVVFPVG